MAWVKKNYGWLLAFLLVTQPAWAESEGPSLELLEFLAEWQDEEGEWVDPVEFSGSKGGTVEREDHEENSNE